VTDYVLDFENLLEQVFNGNFHMVLPMSFKKIEVEPKSDTSNLSKRTLAGGNISNDPDPNPKKGKRKSEDGNGNLVSNSAQDEEFKVRTGETWKDTFSKQFPLDRPLPLMARWHIKGDCFDNCARKASHVTKDKMPSEKRASFLALMKKCRICLEEASTKNN
jgi:hypothetical protein